MLTPFGQEIVGPSARRVRERVLLLASFRRWDVLHHESYADWLHSNAAADLLWIVLDPLLDRERLPAESVSLRITRRATPAGWELSDTLPAALLAVVSGRRVGLIDDVAYSGQTLRFVIEQLAGAGARVDRVFLASATAEAEASLAGEVVTELRRFLNRACPAIHLRDGCFFLPFGGRRLSGLDSIACGDRCLPLRVPATLFPGGLWEELGRDPGVQTALSQAAREIVARCHAALGREPLVRDAALFGDDVAVVLTGPFPPDPDAPLASLFGAKRQTASPAMR